MIINNIFIISLFLFFLLNKNRHRWYIAYFTVGKLFQTVSFIGIGLRGQIPDVLSIHLSNFFLIFSFAVNTYAVVCYDGEFRKCLFIKLLAIALLFFCAFCAFVHHEKLRLAIQIWASVATFGYGGVLLLMRPFKYRFLYLISYTLLFFAAFQFMRSMVILNYGQGYNFFKGSNIDSLYFLVSTLALNVTSIGFLFLLLEMNFKTIDEKNKIIEKDKAELQVLIQTQNKFFSIIAHDLRGPIGSITTMLECINDQYRKQQCNGIQQNLESIEKVSRNTRSLLENLLTWATVHSGQIQVSRAKQNLRILIHNNIKLLSLSAAEKNIQLHNLVDLDIVCQIDLNMINTVFRNLISNAIKYSFEGSHIEVSCKIDAGLAQISVADQGTGIHPVVLNRLFRIEERNNSVQGTRGEMGTGLGLILCKEFVEKHGGKIWVETRQGTGSTFKFTLPIESNV